ncbi:hypothetical protein [Afipia sp. Root123D2]|uniref:hypothetical protein n=1 Tax=Afipia sp. Root123D2 TaxID=1736436 RepID=UPI0012E8761A|nr:hypothetical protein [Afipia sp. Root123D2]
MLKLLASNSIHVQSGRTTTTLRILMITEWSARIVSISVATLTGIAITLMLSTNGETTARANTVIADNASHQAKTDPLFSRHRPTARGQFVIAAPAAATDTMTTPGSRFAFIRGGLDDTMLTWSAAKRPKAIEPVAQGKRRPHRARKPRLKPAVRTVTTEDRHQPWLIDLLVRHLARGS